MTASPETWHFECLHGDTIKDFFSIHYYFHESNEAVEYVVSGKDMKIF